MVQSPFRYKKPKGKNPITNIVYGPPLSSAAPPSNNRSPSSNSQRATIWIGGATIGERSHSSLRRHSFIESLRGLFWNTERYDTEEEESVRKDEDDSENCYKYQCNAETSPTSLADENDVNSRRNTSLSTNDSIPPPRSVTIGGKLIIGESSVPLSDAARFESTQQRLQQGSGSTSFEVSTRASSTSIDCDGDTVNIGDVVESQEGFEFEKAADVNDSTPCDNDDSTYGSTCTKTGSCRIGETLSRPDANNRRRHNLHIANDSVFERRRLSKRMRTRLTAQEVSSHVQPGRHYNSMVSRDGHYFDKRKALTLPKTMDFFRRVLGNGGGGFIAVNVLFSVASTSFVLYACSPAWQNRLEKAWLGVSVLGAFLSFALVFRTQSCYARWWEARSQWGKMTSAIVQLAGQARVWFDDNDHEELVDRFLTQCVVFPYACKASLRGNSLNDAVEEGPRFLECGMLSDADIGTLMRHGRPPFACLQILRRIMCEALRVNGHLPPTVLNGAFLAMEQILWELNSTFGACNKINSTRMPASYTIFMRSFIIFFFILANVSWAPTIGWLAPISTCFMVFMISTVIVIGDQMIRPFDIDW
eukprot:CAMPEP_0183748886 /NCGR_PEP_ID=MMETSP0737-20130205/68002_1 /TAXON_ID=385413 /ORGANISM="Thalassiosira miniscula, Strain CCMP1093" /LENGTH=588 /DNA_ID=CAMNT_0025984629 /DNA_START=826 /DNA_END=2589 /DNA_ORIENTATION=-